MHTLFVRRYFTDSSARYTFRRWTLSSIVGCNLGNVAGDCLELRDKCIRAGVFPLIFEIVCRMLHFFFLLFFRLYISLFHAQNILGVLLDIFPLSSPSSSFCPCDYVPLYFQCPAGFLFLVLFFSLIVCVGLHDKSFYLQGKKESVEVEVLSNLSFLLNNMLRYGNNLELPREAILIPCFRLAAQLSLCSARNCVEHAVSSLCFLSNGENVLISLFLETGILAHIVRLLGYAHLFLCSLLASLFTLFCVR